jgi:hypothetical protein
MESVLAALPAKYGDFGFSHHVSGAGGRGPNKALEPTASKRL